MTPDRFDVVVVGGGVSGAVVAKELSAQGRRVLILEAGTEDVLDLGKYHSYLESFYASTIRATSTGYPPNADAPFPDVLQIGKSSDQSYYVQSSLAPTLNDDGSWSLPFLSDYVRMVGGTTLHWQGSTFRMLPADFRMHSEYGQGLDWPLGYDDLEPFYRKAEHEIGVAADVKDQSYLGVKFPDGYVYPMRKMPQSYLDRFFIEALGEMTVKIDGVRYPVRVISVPQGRNSAPNPDYVAPDGTRGYRPVSAVGDRDKGLRCQGNSSCMPICPVQAKYSALKTIASIAHRPSVRIQTRTVASRLIIDRATGRVTGVEYKRYDDPNSPRHATGIARGVIVVLAANAIENATLMLASGTSRSSGQLGRNLMDHPYLYAWGSAPRPVWPFRGPDTTSGLDSLRDGRFRARHAAFRASLSNWGWPGSPASDVRQLVARHVYGDELRRAVGAQLSTQVKLGIMLEQLPDSRNGVSIDPAARDRLGNYRPVIDYRINEYSLAGAEAASRVAKFIFERCHISDKTSYIGGRAGYQYVTFNGRGYNLMGSGHIVGTHRMGHRRSNSVVDRDLRSWDHDNLYLVGCGSMVTIGTSNPTLTGVALAYKAADAILRRLR
jgi:choline dehydrogenase-like flavoprotein